MEAAGVVGVLAAVVVVGIQQFKIVELEESLKRAREEAPALVAAAETEAGLIIKAAKTEKNSLEWKIQNLQREASMLESENLEARRVFEMSEEKKSQEIFLAAKAEKQRVARRTAELKAEIELNQARGVARVAEETAKLKAEIELKQAERVASLRAIKDINKLQEKIAEELKRNRKHQDALYVGPNGGMYTTNAKGKRQYVTPRKSNGQADYKYDEEE